tara:strand:+ start:3559 stop:6288 length:2730 start_codon:yes stop_codon:yes gene_type:complete
MIKNFLKLVHIFSFTFLIVFNNSLFSQIGNNSYDFEQGDEVNVALGELGDAEAWSIEFFIAFHGDTWRNADQIFFERYLSDGDRDIWLESSMDTESNSLVFEFYLDSFTPEDEPLALSIPEQDVLLGPAFNYVLVNYDGEELNLNFVGNNSKHFHSHLSIENALFPGNGYNFEFGGGGIESAYTMDEVHIMTDILEYPNGFEVPNVKHDPYDETILLWHFNEIGGSIIFDSSDLGNDGTINGNGVWESLDAFDNSGDDNGNDNGNDGDNDLVNTIELEVHLFDPIGNGNVVINLWFPNSDFSSPDVSITRGEGTPSPQGGWRFQINDPGITPNNGPYEIEVFFDLNNNQIIDNGEPYRFMPEVYTNDQGYEYIALDLFDDGDEEPESTVEIVYIDPPIDVYEGNDAEIRVGIATKEQIVRVKFDYFIGESNNLYSIPLNGGDALGGGDWIGIIPSDDVTLNGIVGRIIVEDIFGYITESDEINIDVLYEEFFVTNTGSKSYKMISVPGYLDRGNSLFDALGEENPEEWRTFRWENGSYYEAFSADMEPGKAYWIITREPTDLIAGGGVSMSLQDTFYMSLDEGWNQIGNPFNFNPIFSYDDSQIQGSIYRYNGSGYSISSDFEPGEGYWIYANENSELLLYFDKKLDRKILKQPFDWEGSISARINNFEDKNNKFGVIENASNEWDYLDRNEPPVIGQYISLAFDNTTWSEKPGYYSSDIKKSNLEGYEWKFRVLSNESGAVNLDINWTDELPSDWDLILVDKSIGKMKNLKNSNSYDFICACENIERQFVLIAGPKEFTERTINSYELLPKEFELSQNFPNPFNAITTVKFSLPLESMVSLEIYDLLGKKITTLSNDIIYSAGNHSLVWNGKNELGDILSTGVYFLRIEAISNNEKTYSASRKMIMLK